MMQEMQKEFKKLKQKGYTLQEIGTQYGISRQRVFQVLNYDYQRSSAPQPAIEQIVYPNIRGWLIKNDKTPKQLAKMADIPYYTLYSNITGRTKLPQLKTARKLSNVLDMSIKETFEKN